MLSVLFSEYKSHPIVFFQNPWKAQDKRGSPASYFIASLTTHKKINEEGNTVPFIKSFIYVVQSFLNNPA